MFATFSIVLDVRTLKMPNMFVSNEATLRMYVVQYLSILVDVIYIVPIHYIKTSSLMSIRILLNIMYAGDFGVFGSDLDVTWLKQQAKSLYACSNHHISIINYDPS